EGGVQGRVGTSEPEPGEQLVEQLPGLADERDALLVLVEAGRLADEHQVGVRIAGAKDDLRPSLRAPAARARAGRCSGAGSARSSRWLPRAPRASRRARPARHSLSAPTPAKPTPPLLAEL